jgi:hypothetical protein
MRFLTDHGLATRLAGAAFIFASLLVGTAFAQNPIQDALKGCDKEIKEFCSKVTPGQGRLVACAQAHVDKLSDQCIGSINRADYQLKNFALVLSYIATQCKDDAVKQCPKVKLGEGRVLNCLAKNKEKLSKFCDTALTDVGAYK